MHKVERLLLVPGELGLSYTVSAPSLPISAEVRQLVAERLLETTGLDLPRERVIVWHHGCEPAFRGKLWPMEKWLPVLEDICRKSAARCLMVWGPGDEDFISEGARLSRGKRFLVITPWKATIQHTSAILSLCQMALTNDSGVMHLAAAVGTRVLAVFGPTDPGFCGPYGTGGSIYRKVPCGPCYPEHRFYNCPYSRRCLTEIPVEKVSEAALRMLDGYLPSAEEDLGDGVFLLPSPTLALRKRNGAMS